MLPFNMASSSLIPDGLKRATGRVNWTRDEEYAPSFEPVGRFLEKSQHQTLGVGEPTGWFTACDFNELCRTELTNRTIQFNALVLE